MSALALMMTRPRPVENASRIPLVPQIMPPVGKSGPDMLHQLRYCDLGVVEQCDGCVDGFREVMRRYVGGHAYGDSLRSVDEQVGESSRKHERLLTCVVVVGLEVDCF